ncbi:MAG: EFR1 family ferrodoxin [Spirochaetota bacterium]
MIDSVTLFYFSGTGNSEKLALTFYRLFRKSVSSCSVYRIEDHLRGKSRPMLQNTVAGILFPVYFFHMPRIVHTFLLSTLFSPGTRVFLIGVPSEDTIFNTTALKSARSILKRKKATVIHESCIPMPQNIKIKYPDAVSARLLYAAEKRIPAIVEQILALHTERSFPNPVTAVLRLFRPAAHLRARRFGFGLRVSGKCIHCGLCIRQCPTRNIRMDIGVKFSGKCTLCMRCIYNCPAGAISPSSGTHLPIIGGYDLDSSLHSHFPMQLPHTATRSYPRNLKSYFTKHLE